MRGGQRCHPNRVRRPSPPQDPWRTQAWHAQVLVQTWHLPSWPWQRTLSFAAVWLPSPLLSVTLVFPEVLGIGFHVSFLLPRASTPVPSWSGWGRRAEPPSPVGGTKLIFLFFRKGGQCERPSRPRCSVCIAKPRSEWDLGLRLSHRGQFSRAQPETGKVGLLTLKLTKSWGQPMAWRLRQLEPLWTNYAVRAPDLAV